MRVGVIGLGVGERHLETTLLAGHEVVGICDFSREKLESVGNRFDLQLASRFLHWESMLELDLDVVVIASRDQDHFEQTHAFLTRGVSVFSEKPLASSSTELETLERLLTDSPNIGLGANFRLRHEPWVRELKNKLENGDFGQVVEVKATYWYGRQHKIKSGWRGEDPRYSPILGGGIHMFDLGLHLSKGDWMSTQTRTMKSQVSNPLHRYDYATSSVVLERDCLLTVVTNFCAPIEHYHGLEVIGTEGTYIRNPWTNSKETRISDPHHKSRPLLNFLGHQQSGEALHTDWGAVNSSRLAIASEESAIAGGKTIFKGE